MVLNSSRKKINKQVKQEFFLHLREYSWREAEKKSANKYQNFLELENGHRSSRFMTQGEESSLDNINELFGEKNNH